MGKASRKKSADRKKRAKQLAKAAKRALYASYAGTGRKVKKNRKKAGATPQRGNHVMSDCGNPGCERCYPQFRVARQNEKPLRVRIVFGGI
jgi:hypothetical protein